MRIQFNQREFDKSSLQITDMKREEAATLYFALREYADNLEKSYVNAMSQYHDDPKYNDGRNSDDLLRVSFEDRCFLADALAKVHAFLFQLTSDVTVKTPVGETDRKEGYQHWLDVI